MSSRDMSKTDRTGSAPPRNDGARDGSIRTGSQIEEDIEESPLDHQSVVHRESAPFDGARLPSVPNTGGAQATAITYGRRDYVPWSERPLLQMITDFPDMLRRVITPLQPIALGDVIRRVEHMWGISDDKIALEADPRVVKLLNDLYARRTSDPAKHGYIGDLVYQYERDCKANRSLLMMSVDMVVVDGDITVKSSLFRSPGISYEDHRDGSDKATKALLLAVLSFARGVKDSDVTCNSLHFEAILGGYHYAWFNLQAAHQFGLTLEKGNSISLDLQG